MKSMEHEFYLNKGVTKKGEWDKVEWEILQNAGGDGSEEGEVNAVEKKKKKRIITKQVLK